MADDTELPDAIHTSALTFDEPATDPEAHAVITDFLDYTEYLPSDLIRSFTLIRQLDQAYNDASAKVHDLTLRYGTLPQIPAPERPDAQAMRQEISRALDRAMSCREASFAESTRISQVVKKHQVRLGLIKTKLQALPKPPSRDPTPPAVLQSTRSRKAASPVKLKSSVADKTDKTPKAPKKVTVPNPPILEQAASGAEIDEPVTEQQMEGVEEDEEAVEGEKQAAPRADAPKTPKPKTPKPRRLGPDGQVLHYRVQEISTSAKLAQLTPPPENAPRGSKWRPWLQLTQFEMAKIRKMMKKNVAWQPSPQMVERELANDKRDKKSYEAAKAEAEAEGLPFLDEKPDSKDTDPESGINIDWSSPQDGVITNTGMKLNEAKKKKKEARLSDQQGVGGENVDTPEVSHVQTRRHTRQSSGQVLPLEDHITKLQDLSLSMKNFFDITPEAKGAQKKRKRGAKDTPSAQVVTPSTTSPKRDPKRQKVDKPSQLVLPSRSPRASRSKAISPVKVTTTSTTVPLAPEGPSSPVPMELDVDAQVESIETPTEVKESRKRVPTPVPTAAQSRPRRISTAPKDAAASAEPQPSPMQMDTPVTRSSGRIRKTVKAASAEPAPSKRDVREPRRLSINASTPPVIPPRSTRSGGRRTVPGFVTSEDNATSKVSQAGRKNKPKKQEVKKTTGSRKSAGADEAADEEDVVDPNEETYCLCDDVSYGTMVACSNDMCEREWFHLECVGLKTIPPRRAEWYCPLCQVIKNVTVHGSPKAEPARPVPSRRR
ncbi:hypothetical protein BT63DRAFT_456363 [Microthyrium microscopicum]|uniref:Chromatin modification-related protein n=1 Tax=Microthyrium microscopicum TaxID=703497 RepID=A0A6A6U967_9PEZI|nr:hypothetical protein BT63DRAFT_456363 [Microthyrium microscopicum]